MEAYFAKNEARLTPKKGKTLAERREHNKQALAKAREAVRLKIAQREIVRRKVEQGLPITEEERRILTTRFGRVRQQGEKEILAAASKLMLQPKSVDELRRLVETTAAKYHYNPIEKLIFLTDDNNVDVKDKIGIHKALLPFLCPVLPAPKAGDLNKSSQGTKVVITQFTFPADQPNSEPLHKQAPAVIEAQIEPPDA